MSASQAVLITGCSSGFGRLTAELLATDGHRVFATMRDAEGRNREVADALRSLGNIRVLDMDVTSETSVNAAVSEALGETGHIDCVVNNAGFGNFGITEAYTPEQWQALFDTNVFGAVRVNRAVLPSMRKRRSGLLIHVTSLAGRVPAAYLGPYSASKWALEAYAEILRLEVAALGIDSVVVEPGKYRTEIFGKMSAPADAACAAEYGQADFTERFMNAFVRTMEELAQDPAEIARAVRSLMQMPASERPFRTPLGEDTKGLISYNQIADHIREQVAERFEIPEMLPYKKAASA